MTEDIIVCTKDDNFFAILFSYLEEDLDNMTF